MEKKNQTSET